MRSGLLVMAFSLTFATPAEPCALVDRDPNQLSTGIGSERAIIVYDAASQTEHFIRSAEFRGREGDFGFIVPTPSVPELGEVDDSVFDVLAKAWEAARPLRRPLELTSTLTLSRAAPAKGLVQVLGSAHVAGLDVTVVKATERSALESWLQERGLLQRPALSAWLEHYVARGFVFSAFRYSGGPVPVTSKAVRLSFQTPVPVYPYLEPTDARPRFEALDVWLVSSERRAWDDEAPGEPVPSVWWATNQLTLPPALAALSKTERPFVTLFHDTRTQRPPGDVRFPAAKDVADVVPPPRLEPIPIPVEGLLCVGVVITGLIVFLGRRPPQGVR